MSQDDKAKTGEWREIYELPELFAECPECFAVVEHQSQAKHTAWHEAQRKQQRELESTPDHGLWGKR